MLGFILFVAFNYFDGWYVLAAIAVELAVLMFLYHLYRWCRYPGLFQSKSSGKLLFDVSLSILFLYNLPLIAILAKLHLARFFPIDQFGSKLGLEFKFKIRDLVTTSGDAPSHVGEIGRIRKIWVAAENTNSQMQLKVGEVVYKVQFRDEVLDVPERYVVHVVNGPTN